MKEKTKSINLNAYKPFGGRISLLQLLGLIIALSSIAILLH